MNIGRKIFYDSTTGEVIHDTGERSGDVVEMTDAEWVERIQHLKDRVQGSFAVLDLAYGEYAQDFMESNGVKVDVTGAAPTLVFSYPDPNNPGTPPVYQKPLSEQIAELKDELARTNADFTGFQDFYFEKNPTQA